MYYFVSDIHLGLNHLDPVERERRFASFLNGLPANTKGYKGGITAGFWQGVAKLFGSDLKKPYDKYGEDKNVEELVEMYHQGTFDFLYYSMFNK